jgi:hypothetical protein
VLEATIGLHTSEDDIAFSELSDREGRDPEFERLIIMVSNVIWMKLGMHVMPKVVYPQIRSKNGFERLHAIRKSKVSK